MKNYRHIITGIVAGILGLPVILWLTFQGVVGCLLAFCAIILGLGFLGFLADKSTDEENSLVDSLYKD